LTGCDNLVVFRIDVGCKAGVETPTSSGNPVTRGTIGAIATISLFIHTADKSVDGMLADKNSRAFRSGSRVDTVVVDGKSNKDRLYSVAARD